MNDLKKLTLASAIATASFSSHALQEMDDASMGDVTGQEGITIDQIYANTIEEFQYVDADGDGTTGASAGKIKITGIGIGVDANDDGLINTSDTSERVHIFGQEIDAAANGVRIKAGRIGDENGLGTFTNGRDMFIESIQLGNANNTLSSIGSLAILGEGNYLTDTKLGLLNGDHSVTQGSMLDVILSDDAAAAYDTEFNAGYTYQGSGTFQAIYDAAYEAVGAGSYTYQGSGTFQTEFDYAYDQETVLTYAYQGSSTGDYQAVYDAAYQPAYTSAYNTAYASAYTPAYNTAYANAYTPAYNTAYANAYSPAYDTAYEAEYDNYITNDPLYTGAWASDYDTRIIAGDTPSDAATFAEGSNPGGPSQSTADTNAITIGDTAGIAAGDTAGIAAGDTAGDTAGISAGDAAGDTAGVTAGTSAGDTDGDVAVGDAAGKDAVGGLTGDDAVANAASDAVYQAMLDANSDGNIWIQGSTLISSKATGTGVVIKSEQFTHIDHIEYSDHDSADGSGKGDDNTVTISGITTFRMGLSDAAGGEYNIAKGDTVRGAYSSTTIDVENGQLVLAQEKLSSTIIDGIYIGATHNNLTSDKKLGSLAILGNHWVGTTRIYAH